MTPQILKTCSLALHEMRQRLEIELAERKRYAAHTETAQRQLAEVAAAIEAVEEQEVSR